MLADGQIIVKDINGYFVRAENGDWECTNWHTTNTTRGFEYLENRLKLGEGGGFLRGTSINRQTDRQTDKRKIPTGRLVRLSVQSFLVAVTLIANF